MKRTAVSLLAAGALIAGAAGQATATPAHDSCPLSYQVWIVGSQTPPYHADSLADKDHDGIVCAKPTDKTFLYNGQSYTVYNFIDNKVAAP
jgi:hypothetical protein